MNALLLARSLHVLAVVIWIGGVAMVTTVLLPAVRAGALGADQKHAFEAIERRFVWYARAAVLLTGVTGFYMLGRLRLWPLFITARFWWLHAMVGVWTIFALILFVIDPLGLRRISGRGGGGSEAALARLHYLHIVLLALALITIVGAVIGSRGGML